MGLDREQEGRGLQGKVGPGAGCLPLVKLRALLRNSDLQVQAGLLLGSQAAGLNYPPISPKKHDCIILQRSIQQPTWCVRESKQLRSGPPGDWLASAQEGAVGPLRT